MCGENTVYGKDITHSVHRIIFQTFPHHKQPLTTHQPSPHTTSYYKLTSHHTPHTPSSHTTHFPSPHTTSHHTLHTTHAPPFLQGLGFHFKTLAIDQDLYVGDGEDGLDKLCRLKISASVISASTGGKVEGISITVDREHVNNMQKVIGWW